MFAGNTHTSLFCSSICDEEKKFYNFDTRSNWSRQRQKSSSRKRKRRKKYEFRSFPIPRRSRSQWWSANGLASAAMKKKRRRKAANVAVDTTLRVSPAAQTRKRSFLKAAKLQPPHRFLRLIKLWSILGRGRESELASTRADQHHHQEREKNNNSVHTTLSVSPAAQTRKRSILRAAKLQPPHRFLWLIKLWSILGRGREVSSGLLKPRKCHS